MATIEIYADTRGAARCRGCHARITWAEVVKSGKKMCFEGSPVALSTRHDDGHRLIETLDLGENHWGALSRYCGIQAEARVRSMSFALTTKQVRNQTKTEQKGRTRRG